VSPWTPLPWQGERWGRIAAAIDGGRLAHALLLAGPRGVGKRHLAHGLAARLLCEAPPGHKPCGECRSCLQLAAGSQPNALVLSPDGLLCCALDPARREGAIPLWQPDKDSARRDIAVDGIRELIARLALAGHYGQSKVAIIEPADGLNPAGANALLKTIEEPPPATHLVLVSERWRALPATLRSRCQILRLAPPPAAAALAWLRQRHPGLPEAALRPLARTPLLEPATAEAAETHQAWGRALADALEGRPSLRIAQGLKRGDAQRGLELWLAEGTARLRADHGRPGAAALLQQLLDDTLEALRALDRNGNPTLLVESIMIRLSQRAAGGR
jgi:DNA polymerase III subunit delta'